MSARNDRSSEGPLTYTDALDRVGALIRGGTRRGICDALVADGDALARLRKCMREHTFPTVSGPLSQIGRAHV